jgi:hypothetical protein
VSKVNKTVVLTGNGLSVALNHDFALPKITERFYTRLSKEHKAFIQHHMGSEYNQLNFEESISSIEQAYDALQNYHKFLVSGENGANFLKVYNLEDVPLEKHIVAIREIIYEYTVSILELIDGHVQQSEIANKLDGFVSWLRCVLTTKNEVDLFTLNFDLLIETILLDIVGTEGFMDFHYKINRPWNEINNKFQYYFNPDMSRQIAGDINVRLHHLHGSLSSFKNISNGRLFKITTESLRESKLYNKIFELELIPSIVTGGGKSAKVQQSPFSFYYNEFKKKMSIDEFLCDELYIIGYSFQDDHINKAIKERLEISRRSKEPRPLNIVIVDYAATEEDKTKFISKVNKELGLGARTRGKFVANDNRIIFEGANGISKLI